MSPLLHIVDLGSILALLFWLIAAVPRLTALSDNAKQAIMFVAVFVVGIGDNAVFYSGNEQLINVVTSLYQLALLAAGAVGATKVVQVTRRFAVDWYANRQELRRINVEFKREQIKFMATPPDRRGVLDPAAAG